MTGKISAATAVGCEVWWTLGRALDLPRCVLFLHVATLQYWKSYENFDKYQKSADGTDKSSYFFYHNNYPPTLIKQKIKFSSYIRKLRVEQLQSHILYDCIRKPFLIYDFATAPL
jgi:hypothetical protein